MDGIGPGTGERSAARTQSALPATMHDVIGNALRRHYDDLLQEAVPARMLALLAELEAKELAEAPGTANDD